MHKSSRNEDNCAYPRSVDDPADSAALTKRAGAGVDASREDLSAPASGK